MSSKAKRVTWCHTILDTIIKRQCECQYCSGCKLNKQCIIFGEFKCILCNEWRCTICINLVSKECNYCKRIL